MFWAGHLTTASRRGSFERVYDLTNRVIWATILPTPPVADAHRALLEQSAVALGIATAGDLRDHFRLKPDLAHPRIQELVEAGTLIPVTVEGWRQPGYLHTDARIPRRILGQALLAPFDPLIWERSRTERLFGFRYRLEIYVPAERRVHGYYVLPFLMDERIVTRLNLKADRQRSALRVQAASAEPRAPTDASVRLANELRGMARWLGLERVEVNGTGDLVATLRAAISPR
jgi:hypothetical protein